MKLSSKVLVLWGARIFLLPLPFSPLFEKCFPSVLSLWGVYLLLSFSVFTLFYIRYKTFTIISAHIFTEISSGFFIRRCLHIKYGHILACTKIYTPLSQKLGLCNLVIYCEGSTFLLPPMDSILIEHIETDIKRAVKRDEI